MYKKELNIKQLALFILVLISSTLLLSAEWSERNSYGINNLSFTDSEGYFLQIPDSPYIVFYSGNNIITIDINRCKIRGSLVSSHGFRYPTALTDPTSGWNIYYYEEKQLGKLHINPNGEFREDRWLPRTTEFLTPLVGVPDRSEVWYFSDKIMRFSTIDESWTNFDYPQGWDTDFDYVRTYPALDVNSIIGISKGNTIQDYQAFILDIETGSSKFIPSEIDFFKGIKDVEEWKGHPGYFIIMKNNEIYSYDFQTGSIVLLFKDFGVTASIINQEKSGHFLYMIGNSDQLYVFDLYEKTVTSHSLPVEEGMVIGGGFFDSKRNKIISFMGDGWIVKGYVIIDLDDFSVSFLDNLQDYRFTSDIFLEFENAIFYSTISYIYSVNLETCDIKNTIPIIYRANSWSIVEDMNKSILLNNTMGTDFIRILPNGGRETHNIGITPDLACQFPDSRWALIGEKYIRNGTTNYNYKEYDFENRESIDITFPNVSHSLITDLKNNQIIGIGRYGFDVQFIKPHGSVRSWVTPRDLYFTYGLSIFDDQNSIIWLFYHSSDIGKLFFYKISAKTRSEEDSFILQNNELTNLINLSCDPDGKYLYFIDETNSNSRRELVIFDTNKKEVMKRITLQDDVHNGSFDVKVIPGIVPVPEKERLFIWDHYGAWSIDMNSWEIIYGETRNNPQASMLPNAGIINPHIQGAYDPATNHVIVIDMQGRVLEVDFDTGQIVKEYAIPSPFLLLHFTQDKKNILFLNQEKSTIYTLHLDPAWENPPSIYPSTNYMQFGQGDHAIFSVNIKNTYDFEQKVTAYIWIYNPNSSLIFFDGTGFTTNITGIHLKLPPNLDVTQDFSVFKMPQGVPQGYYNLNAVFINEHGDRGPIGTWNFYVKN
jgi:hypothetical protein